ncbi:hypothetical protein NNO04_19535 [Citrobacter sp. Awk 4]|uniref:hypothetical protein n=1 Tax=Citrobacter sp. Awk 4 TaxID=2963955 RepID=UPI002304A79B|nr:hypothetical protein [Citrobacter sp. Awk 4]MDA8480880.1 hypothetical protein [Citrobacter sp. Awk 4]
MPEWTTFINSLGKSESSKEFVELNNSIGEFPISSEDPAEYNDPVGHTKYVKYPNSGLEIGFRKGVVSHVHFYFDRYEGYGVFKGKLLSGIGSGWSEKSVIQELGPPSFSGEGKMDMLLGYINKWAKYEQEGYALHLQYDQNDQLCRSTLMYVE